MALDADPEVVRVAAQPMWLRWTAESGRSVRHAPDYFARRADGTGVVLDVRADERIGEQDAAVFAATGRLSAPVGWVTVALRGLRVRADAWARVDPPHPGGASAAVNRRSQRAQPGHVAAPASLLALANCR